MINWGSLTMEKVIIDQPWSRVEVVMFILIVILIFIAFYLYQQIRAQIQIQILQNQKHSMETSY